MSVVDDLRFAEAVGVFAVVRFWNGEEHLVVVHTVDEAAGVVAVTIAPTGPDGALERRLPLDLVESVRITERTLE